MDGSSCKVICHIAAIDESCGGSLRRQHLGGGTSSPPLSTCFQLHIQGRPASIAPLSNMWPQALSRLAQCLGLHIGCKDRESACVCAFHHVPDGCIVGGACLVLLGSGLFSLLSQVASIATCAVFSTINGVMWYGCRDPRRMWLSVSHPPCSHPGQGLLQQDPLLPRCDQAPPAQERPETLPPLAHSPQAKLQ